jgi:hypothetical protein
MPRGRASERSQVAVKSTVLVYVQARVRKLWNAPDRVRAVKVTRVCSTTPSQIPRPAVPKGATEREAFYERCMTRLRAAEVAGGALARRRAPPCSRARQGAGVRAGFALGRVHACVERRIFHAVRPGGWAAPAGPSRGQQHDAGRTAGRASLHGRDLCRVVPQGSVKTTEAAPQASCARVRNAQTPARHDAHARVHTHTHTHPLSHKHTHARARAYSAHTHTQTHTHTTHTTHEHTNTHTRTHAQAQTPTPTPTPTQNATHALPHARCNHVSAGQGRKEGQTLGVL